MPFKILYNLEANLIKENFFYFCNRMIMFSSLKNKSPKCVIYIYFPIWSTNWINVNLEVAKDFNINKLILYVHLYTTILFKPKSYDALSNLTLNLLFILCPLSKFYNCTGNLIILLIYKTIIMTNRFISTITADISTLSIIQEALADLSHLKGFCVQIS